MILVLVNPIAWLAVVGLLSLIAAAGAVFNFPFFGDRIVSAIDAAGSWLATLMILGGAFFASRRQRFGYLVSALGCLVGAATLIIELMHHMVGTETGFFAYLGGFGIAVMAFVNRVNARWRV